jgi:hypothetical protein
MTALNLGELRRALEAAAHLPDDAPVRIEVDRRELVATQAGPESLTIEGTAPGHTYQGVEHLRIHARSATNEELVEIYLAAPGQTPDGYA